MDVIEIPSHFMQNFMNDPGVVGKFARHHSTGDVVPTGLVEQTLQDSQLFGALDMESQVWHIYSDLFWPTLYHAADINICICLCTSHICDSSLPPAGLSLNDGPAVSRC